MRNEMRGGKRWEGNKGKRRNEDDWVKITL